ncbi:tRNA (adenosine(37)-N6)-threonylcarbamoyltransferase complex dimerization subunit type 1 TsaB [Asticcacaulis sp. BYS171W]|uniref:tRNA (Adenosine(37)-N6)-threonylcarbamoyltransferase complex dimerization subunit type 1 TsaB n=1 Tax=Asticcacaulis aquaticus TaxID=2984212 RepID=A0ABT5HSM8_9CAUL|nr:tRNA (adenosine(37)-N6)-threonylcarbamoyltransferase complex dimerization subunit type 1 TsaB [Asticcacaulis aquaticus]MDC7683070.1 tRNA (adenosine(37)-N6)-threonylcarbamoyltransferase complex dimerization subunit type 1 TsaB [Asticcacaulis aquaticus]
MTRYALVIDTALNACQVGLFSHDGTTVTPLFIRSEEMTRGHQEFIGPAVAESFEKSGTIPKALSVIGVTLGPGSFTGLRVGLSFAKGMAGGLDLPLRGFFTLELMGRRADFDGRTRLVAHDAGRGQLYLQTLDTEGHAYDAKSFDINDLSEVEALTPPDLIIGSGAGYLADIFPSAEVIPAALPDLSAMAALCFADTQAYDDLTPLYMRDADAKVSNKAVISFDF